MVANVLPFLRCRRGIMYHVAYTKRNRVRLFLDLLLDGFAKTGD